MMESIVAVKLIVRVPCAIIEHDGKILAGHETDEETLVREIREELDVEIEIFEKLPVTTKDQGWREIILVPFVCKLKTFEMTLSEHEQILWLDPQDLLSLNWTAGDLDIIRNYYTYLAGK
jgi:8-oxo-dGTP diphosphatase